jgi:hypothetical protein
MGKGVGLCVGTGLWLCGRGQTHLGSTCVDWSTVESYALAVGVGLELCALCLGCENILV